MNSTFLPRDAVADSPGELRQAMAHYRSAFLMVGLLSIILNLLMLAGSIYMMLVYDSVLPSQSIPTLFGLLVMVIAAYGFQGVFDNLRTRILGDVATALDQTLSGRVRQLITVRAIRGQRSSGDGLQPLRDLDSIRNFLSGAGPATLIDLPWIIFFLLVLFVLHPWIGLTALVGALLLVGLTVATHYLTRQANERLGMLAARRWAQAENGVRHMELFMALGMEGRMGQRWDQVNRDYLDAVRAQGRIVGMLGGVSRIGRMALQSVILTVGAFLVIDGKASGGVIFASSLLSARALAPVDQAIANWRTLAAARLGWIRLTTQLRDVPLASAPATLLPRPCRDLTVENLFVTPPGATSMVVQGIDFVLQAGDGLAIVGPSAAGKSSIGRALTGIWPSCGGTIRLDGAALDQWPAETLGRYVGYLPQQVELLAGSIAQNIARFDPEGTSEAIIAAARSAGVHDMIVALPQGYEAQVGPDGRNLSIGQQQRIGLARALYGDPFLILLDEPNSNLDIEGEDALGAAIGSVRARGGIIIVIAHRMSVLTQVNKAMIVRNGRIHAFGPSTEIMDLAMTPVAAPIWPSPSLAPPVAWPSNIILGRS